MPDDFDFGIQDSFSSGGQQLLEDILNDTAVSADPKEVTPISAEDEKKAVPPKKSTTQTPRKEKKGEDNEEEDNEESDPFSFLKEEEDNEQDEDNEEEKDETSDDDDESEEEDNTFETLSKNLIKLGVFQEDEDLGVPQNPEQFLERFNIEASRKAESDLRNYLTRFGEDRIRIFDAIYNKNVDPRQYLETFVKVENFANLDLTRPDNQEKVVRYSLKSQGLDPEDVDAEIEKLKEYGDLENASQRYHKAVVKRESQELQRQEQEAEQKLQAERQRKAYYISAINSIVSDKLKKKSFDGIPLTPALADDTINFLTKDTHKLPSGELLTDFDVFVLDLQKPENYSKKVKIALLEKHNWDLSKVASKLISNESGELFEGLARQKKTKKKASTQKADASFW